MQGQFRGCKEDSDGMGWQIVPPLVVCSRSGRRRTWSGAVKGVLRSSGFFASLLAIPDSSHLEPIPGSYLAVFLPVVVFNCLYFLVAVSLFFNSSSIVLMIVSY